MRTLHLAPGAIADIRRILQRSKTGFGPGAGARDQALQDLREDPYRVGVRPVPDVRPGYFVDHVKFSKPRVTGRLDARAISLSSRSTPPKPS